MKALVLSDIHVDIWFCYAVKPNRLRLDDPKEDVVFDTMDDLWERKHIPETDAIIIPGDLSNDYLTFTREITWLAKKYKQVYLVAGNHDLVVRGGTPSKSNLQFTSSEAKIAAMLEYCKQFDNVHMLENTMHNGIAGCMGFCDFKCECNPKFDYRTDWKRHWFDGKHWRYFNQEPGAIWNYYEDNLNKLVPTADIVVTHFAPYETGVPFEYRNDPWNKVFYFNALPFMEQMKDNSYWLFGHVHDPRIAHWLTDSGKLITLMCNPLGYPQDNPYYTTVYDAAGQDLQRKTIAYDMNDFIIDIQD